MMTPISIDNIEIAKSNIVSQKKKKLREACKGFEAVFINEMLKAMRKTIPKSGLLDGGLPQRLFESMLDEKLAESASKRGALGLADILYREFAPLILNKEGQSR